MTRPLVRTVSLGKREAVVRAVRVILSIGLLSAGLLVAWRWSQSNDTCRSCHTSVAAPASPHQSAGCPSCHRPAGVLGASRQAVALGRMVVRQYTEQVETTLTAGAGELDESACLRCHRGLMRADADRNRSVRLNHGHLWRLGVACGRCHDTYGHTPQTATARSAMSECMRCHQRDGDSVKCGYCHIGKPSDVASGERVASRSGALVIRTCRGCHDAELAGECVACHGGYEMPHPDGWVEDHPYDGLTDQSDCHNCHRAPSGVPPAPHGAATGGYGGAFCNRCHTYPSPHGDSADWIRLHGPASRGRHVKQEVCLPCHSDTAVSACTECHSQESCQGCHRERDERAGRR